MKTQSFILGILIGAVVYSTTLYCIEIYNDSGGADLSSEGIEISPSEPNFSEGDEWIEIIEIDICPLCQIVEDYPVDEVLICIDEEPELPGEPPAEMRIAINEALKTGDSDFIIECLRITVKATKESIAKRITQRST